MNPVGFLCQTLKPYDLEFSLFTPVYVKRYGQTKFTIPLYQTVRSVEAMIRGVGVGKMHSCAKHHKEILN